MKAAENDRPLSELFQAQRRQDSAQAPAFASLVPAQPWPRAHAASWLRWASFSAAAAVLIAAGVGLWLAFAQRDLTATNNLPQLTALAKWSASTDVLLTMPTPLWGSQVETVTDTLGDSSTASSSSTTTNNTPENP